MLKKIKASLLCTSVLLSFNSWSIEQASLPLSINLGFHYEFPANGKKTVTNFAFWTINAQCEVTTEGNSATEIEAILLNNGHTCSVNNITLKKCSEIQLNDSNCNDRVSMSFRTGDLLNLSIDSGAQVELTNHSANAITLDCSI